jgi:phosphoribosylformimino-5-aminoimidazole carboxamide ribotide isomerase
LRWVVYTDVARDGMGTGLNVAATARLAAETGLHVIGSGGVRSLDDVTRTYQAGLSGVIVGRALYEGQVDLPEALQIGRSASHRDGGGLAGSDVASADGEAV